MKNPKNKSIQNSGIRNDIVDAIETVYNFIEQVTGQAPSEAEIAGALRRYFVLNEIKAHIVMERSKK
jgi:hypothetical protein